MSNHEVKNVLNAIMEAQIAYDEQPGLLAKIRELESAKAEQTKMLQDQLDSINRLTEELVDTESKLSGKESELEAATFRELLAQEKLEKVAGFLNGISSVVTEPSQDQPQSPAVSEAPQELATESSPVPFGSSNSGSTDSPTQDQKATIPEPTDRYRSLESYGLSDGQHTPSPQGQSDTDPTIANLQSTSTSNGSWTSPTPSAGYTEPTDSYRPSAFYNFAWWQRPTEVSEDRFVELGGEATLAWKESRRKAEDEAAAKTRAENSWQF